MAGQQRTPARRPGLPWASASYGLSYVYIGRYLTNRGLSPLVLSAGQPIAAAGLLVLATPFGGLTTPAWRPVGASAGLAARVLAPPRAAPLATTHR